MQQVAEQTLVAYRLLAQCVYNDCISKLRMFISTYMNKQQRIIQTIHLNCTSKSTLLHHTKLQVNAEVVLPNALKP